MTVAQRRCYVADIAELDSEGSRVITEIDGQEIAVFHIEGELHALANYCVHQSGPLCEGPLSGRMETQEDDTALQYDERQTAIRCPWHGWRFDISTGNSLQSDRYTVPTYEVEVENGDVYILR